MLISYCYCTFTVHNKEFHVSFVHYSFGEARTLFIACWMPNLEDQEWSVHHNNLASSLEFVVVL